MEIGAKSELLALIGAVGGGGAVLGSIVAGMAGLLRRLDRGELVDHAAGFAIVGAAGALLVFMLEEIRVL